MLWVIRWNTATLLKDERTFDEAIYRRTDKVDVR